MLLSDHPPERARLLATSPCHTCVFASPCPHGPAEALRASAESEQDPTFHGPPLRLTLCLWRLGSQPQPVLSLLYDSPSLDEHRALSPDTRGSGLSKAGYSQDWWRDICPGREKRAPFLGQPPTQAPGDPAASNRQTGGGYSCHWVLLAGHPETSPPPMEKVGVGV